MPLEVLLMLLVDVLYDKLCSDPGWLCERALLKGKQGVIRASRTSCKRE